MKNPNFFYAYIYDPEIEKFVGYCNFNKNPINNKATMGIVIKSEFQGQGYMRPAMNLLLENAKEKKVKYITDTVSENRERALKVFYDLGFLKVNEFDTKKFTDREIVAGIEKKI